MAASSKTPHPNTSPPPPPPSPLSETAALDLKTNTIPSPTKPSPTSFLDLLPPPRKPHTPKLQSPSRLRYVMNADAPLDVFSKPEEPTKKFVLERKQPPSTPGATANTTTITTNTTNTPSSSSPIQYQGTYHGPCFSRIRRFQGPRKPGVYEKIHEEWIKKALLRQEKDLKWDPETGEPLFDVRCGEE
ncbi:hypothetical protein AOL_s00188g177 [Orbilia oligospora ATCC 24927]|uniref:Uncharacterized protein n=2 Tax=Orbilia oligospora TaxID=2813651 RepID=G1XQG5_ARTOA|nr:hypothetical protein AOL_s00188g177 [Orbilia oligospora ATCC 24927]EGX44509.1 hypothetical protein AOL_s00188g177 [Orbilia oligospora ATCC 24927]KAF3280583.1 hypothetical protein TWF970_002797 [Orbilia oligospora]